jgi:tetratricopeptide (TPR) repeat protein
MPTLRQNLAAWLALGALLMNTSTLEARPSLGGGGGVRGGGGGAHMGGGGMSRPGGGGMPHGGGAGMTRPGGGGMPNLGGGGMSRPGGGNISRPSLPQTRPSLPSVGNKPSLPNNMGSRPSLGGFQPGSKTNFPGAGTNPGLNRPNFPSVSNRPQLKPGSDLKPAVRPGTFPGSGAGGIADRPNIGKPGFPSGATTLPSNRPGFGNIGQPGKFPGKPGFGDGGFAGKDRPGTLPVNPGIGGGKDRPTPLPGPGTRPGQGGGGEQWKPDRPWIGGGGNRPGGGGGGEQWKPGGGGDRPWNGGGNRPGPGPGPHPGHDRPWIGGNPNRPIIGGGNNNNIGNNIINNNVNNINNIHNNVNVNNWNRGGWGYGGGGWGYGGNWNNGGWNNGYWHNHWNNNYVNHHYHGWYNGAWNGNWANNWYGPWALGVTAWGLSSLAGWGYGTTYYNPYYVAAATPVYNYSQPVVVQNYYTTDDSGAQIPAAPQPTAEQLQPFDQGLALFKAGDYNGALQKFDLALRDVPNDPVIHEVRALTLFALGRYQEDGAALNALLATSPGMDWTTMSGLYGDPNAYTQQLRKLEDFCRANKTDAAALFALTYQYLVIGQQETAVNLLKHIVKLQPKDMVSQRMLAALEPEQPAANVAATTSPMTETPATPVNPATPAFPANAADTPQTDLVGNWKAIAGKTTIELTITEDSQYTWQATTADQKPVKLEGQLTSAPDALILSNQAQGDMMGKVKSEGPDKFVFSIAGAPPNDPGLSFSRLK